MASGGGKRGGTAPGLGVAKTDRRLHVRGKERADGLEVEIKPCRIFELGVPVISIVGAAALFFFIIIIKDPY